MTLKVNIGQAKARLSELVSASVRGEDVVLQRDGVPQARIVPIESARADAMAQIAADREAAFGMFAEVYAGYDLDVPNLKRDRVDYDEGQRWWTGGAAS